MSALTFQLPIPARELSPNARCHWSRKAKAVTAARVAAACEANRVLFDSKTYTPPKWSKARCKAVLYHTRAVTPDPDNFIASLKPYLDGLADAGIVANDRELWPERPEYVRVKRLPRVEITIEPE